MFLFLIFRVMEMFFIYLFISLLFKYSCPHFPPITLPCRTHLPPSTFILPHPVVFVHVFFYTCSLTWPFPFFPLLFLSFFRSSHFQFFLYLHASGSIFLTCFVDYIPLIGEIMWYFFNILFCLVPILFYIITPEKWMVLSIIIMSRILIIRK